MDLVALETPAMSDGSTDTTTAKTPHSNNVQPMPPTTVPADTSSTSATSVNTEEAKRKRTPLPSATPESSRIYAHNGSSAKLASTSTKTVDKGKRPAPLGEDDTNNSIKSGFDSDERMDVDQSDDHVPHSVSDTDGEGGGSDGESDSDSDLSKEAASRYKKSATTATASTPAKKIKHKPVTPKNTTFLWNDNMKYRTYNKAPFQLGEEEPKLLTIRLKDTKGKWYAYIFQGRDGPAPPPEWNNPGWIKRANEWHIQILYRTLNKGNPLDSTKRKTRPAWSKRELDNAKRIARRHRKIVQRKLKKSDWDKITDLYNKSVAGTMVRVGERLVTDDSKPKKRASKKFVTNDSETATRNAGGLMAIIKHWDADLYNNGPEDDSEADTPNTEGKGPEKATGIALNDVDQGIGKKLAPRLDDDGDEEMAGMGGDAALAF